MLTIKSEQVFPCDIDDTLLLWGKIPKGAKVVLFTDPYTNEQKYVRVHEGNLRVLQNRLKRGAVVLAWSSSGFPWVAAALKALNIDSPRLIAMTKPFAYMDDKPCGEWMGDRVYLPVDSSYGK